MTLLQMSVQAGLLILAILVVRTLALNRLPKGSFLVLWEIALARLLLPLSLPSPWSIYTIFRKLISGPFPSDGEAGFPVTSKTLVTKAFTPTLAGSGAVSFSPVFTLWLAGLILLSVFFILLIRNSQRELRFALPLENTPAIAVWKSGHQLRRPMQLLQSDRIATPLSIGIFHPRIILPKSLVRADEKTVTYILTHEYFHLRRFDTFWKLLMLCALCIHWFNPLVWAMLVFFQRDLELTCDEMVLRRLGDDAETRQSYAYTLIATAEARSHCTPLASFFRASPAEERIRSVMTYHRPTLPALALAAVLIFCLTNGFAASAAAPRSCASTAREHQEIRIDGTIFSGETVACRQGVASAHTETNAQMATYTDDGSTWHLEANGAALLTLEIGFLPGAEDGWSLYLGYETDGVYQITSMPRVFVGTNQLTISVPEDGDYLFFLVNVSAGKLPITRCTITAQSPQQG